MNRQILISGYAVAAVFVGCLTNQLSAEVADPQLRTDHPWYPGELACSTFERLFATQAEQYQRATGKSPATDEDRALASWFTKGLDGGARLRTEVNTAGTLSDLRATIETFFFADVLSRP